MSEELLTQINDSFNPFQPLPVGDPRYVDCRAVRGDTDILQALGNAILRTTTNPCLLYTGHRGNGKSTELLRLQKYLDEHECLVVYFAADEADIEPENTQYTDILLACTKHLLAAVKDANSQPLRQWMIDRWQDVKGFLLTEIEIEKMTVQNQIAQFGKITTSIKFSPNQRQQIREKLEPHTVSLREALNEFICDAKDKLPDGKKRIVVIADNLDRITLIEREKGKTNHDEIFLDREAQLKGLDCTVIYTIPISMAYSSRATDLQNLYGSPEILPMVMVRTVDGNINHPGLDQMIGIVRERINKLTTINLVPDIFETEESLREICLMSGGHMRSLMSLIQAAIININDWPITERAVRRGMTRLRDDYLRAVEDDEWSFLAWTSVHKQIKNNDKYRKLLLNRCVLHYRYSDENDEIQDWYDIHPLIIGIQQFKDAKAALSLSKNQD
jgi:energy-coupling factor transporter ATP-binding protein EcfA2